jgi:hypothetical protein
MQNNCQYKGKLSRKYNISRVIARTVRRERERFGERSGGLGMREGTSQIPCGSLGTS